MPHEDAEVGAVMERLSLAHVPETILCRNKEVELLSRYLKNSLATKSGCAIYVSGLPGTGKTAAVQHILGRSSPRADLPLGADARVLWQNCMELQGAVGLWQALARQCGAAGKGKARDFAALQRRLKKVFHDPPPALRGKTKAKMWVVVCDEVDALLSTNPRNGKPGRHPSRAALDSLLSWAVAGSPYLCLVTISNDMNLTDALLVGHRQQIKQVHFPSYSKQQLMEIVQQRLGRSEEFLQPRALEYLAMKVETETGDARRMLEYCRRLLDTIAPLEPAPPVGTPTKKHPAPDEAAVPPTKRKNITTPQRQPADLRAADSPPSLAPDTPPEPRTPAGFRPVGLVQAAALFGARFTLPEVPLKQRYLLVAAVLAVDLNPAMTVGSWLDFHNALCRRKRIIAASAAEQDDMVDGLAHQRLVEVARPPRGAPRRLARVFVRVTREAVEHSFCDDDIAVDLLATPPSSLPPCR